MIPLHFEKYSCMQAESMASLQPWVTLLDMVVKIETWLQLWVLSFKFNSIKILTSSPLLIGLVIFNSNITIRGEPIGTFVQLEAFYDIRTCTSFSLSHITEPPIGPSAGQPDHVSVPRTTFGFSLGNRYHDPNACHSSMQPIMRGLARPLPNRISPDRLSPISCIFSTEILISSLLLRV